MEFDLRLFTDHHTSIKSFTECRKQSPIKYLNINTLSEVSWIANPGSQLDELQATSIPSSSSIDLLCLHRFLAWFQNIF
jgi:hypothetical protein